MATAVKTLQNFVAGDWVEATGDEAREIVSPVTGEKLATVPSARSIAISRSFSMTMRPIGAGRAAIRKP